MTDWTQGNDKFRLMAQDAREYMARTTPEQRRWDEKIERVRQLRKRLSVVMGIDQGVTWNGEHLDAIINIADELHTTARALRLDAPVGKLTAPKPVDVKPLASDHLPDLSPEFKQIDESLDRAIAIGRRR